MVRSTSNVIVKKNRFSLASSSIQKDNPTHSELVSERVKLAFSPTSECRDSTLDFGHRILAER